MSWWEFRGFWGDFAKVSILVFAIGQLAVDQVAQCVVGVFDAVIFFEAVATGKIGVGR